MKISEAMKILGLSVPFTAKAAKTVYRQKAMAAHPDKGGSTEKMKQLNVAYTLCSNGVELPKAPKVEIDGVDFSHVWVDVKKISYEVKLNKVLVWFTTKMKLKLHKNRHKGFSYRKESADVLFSQLIKECQELRVEITKRSRQDIISECADVANFAMMIADNARSKL